MELEAHIEMMQSVRAERLLDAAQVATYPLHLEHAPDMARRWWRGLMDDAQDTIQTVRSAGRQGPRFLFNGAAIGLKDLKTRLAAALGGGFAA